MYLLLEGHSDDPLDVWFELCSYSTCSRYKREFGFTIPSRTIIVDDIRVRAVAVVIAHKQTPVPKAVSPAEVETVECITAQLLLRTCM